MSQLFDNVISLQSPVSQTALKVARVRGIAPSHGTTSRISRQSHSRGQRIHNSARPRRFNRCIVERAGAPGAALAGEEFANKDSELLACDVECRLAGIEGFHLELDIPGLDELIGSAPRT
jgi:hypothetical protein